MAAETGEIVVRRYVCLACGALTTVGPRGLLPRHRYTSASIVLALWLWAQLQWPPSRVRALVSPWARAGAGCQDRWASIQRWSRSVRAGRLWSHMPRLPEDMSLRACALRAVQAATAMAPDGPQDEAVVMLGGGLLA